MSRPTGECTRFLSSLVRSMASSTRFAAPTAGHESDEADVGIQCRPDGLRLVATMAGDDDRHCALGLLPLQRTHGGEGEPERFGLGGHCVGDGRFAHDVQQRWRQHSAPRRPRARHRRGRGSPPPSRRVARETPRRHRAAPARAATRPRPSDVERGDPYRLLGALAADEPLDRPVGQDDGVVTRSSRGG